MYLDGSINNNRRDFLNILYLFHSPDLYPLRLRGLVLSVSTPRAAEPLRFIFPRLSRLPDALRTTLERTSWVLSGK